MTVIVRRLETQTTRTEMARYRRAAAAARTERALAVQTLKENMAVRLSNPAGNLAVGPPESRDHLRAEGLHQNGMQSGWIILFWNAGVSPTKGWANALLLPGLSWNHSTPELPRRGKRVSLSWSDGQTDQHGRAGDMAGCAQDITRLAADVTTGRNHDHSHRPAHGQSSPQRRSWRPQNQGQNDCHCPSDDRGRKDVAIICRGKGGPQPVGTGWGRQSHCKRHSSPSHGLGQYQGRRGSNYAVCAHGRHGGGTNGDPEHQCQNPERAEATVPHDGELARPRTGDAKTVGHVSQAVLVQAAGQPGHDGHGQQCSQKGREVDGHGTGIDQPPHRPDTGTDQWKDPHGPRQGTGWHLRQPWQWQVQQKSGRQMQIENKTAPSGRRTSEVGRRVHGGVIPCCKDRRGHGSVFP